MDEEVFAALSRVPGNSKVARKTVWTCDRVARDGPYPMKIEIVVLDFGPSAPPQERFSAHARRLNSVGGLEHYGEASPTVQAAIEAIDWSRLET
jgi:hypothetical protein